MSLLGGGASGDLARDKLDSSSDYGIKIINGSYFHFFLDP